MKSQMVVVFLLVAQVLFAGSLELSLLPGSTVVSEQGGKAYVLITIQATQTVGQQRSPINLSLVLDRSGSMAGKKLEYVKKACIHGIDMLDEQQDRVSLVVYDDKVKVLYPNAPVRKERLKTLIGKIEDRGSTDLNGGMEFGISQALREKNKRFISRVLLLSDGLANEGETDPEKIAKNARLGYKKGLTISTFGVGADYNENLMVAIARQGHGNYYFIESPNQIQSIFEKEFASLLSVVAKRIRLNLDLPSGIKISRMIGFDYQNNTINVNPLYSGAKTSFLVELQIAPKGSKSKTEPLNIGIVYEDMLKNQKQQVSRSLVLDYQKGTPELLQNKAVYSAFVNLGLADRLETITLHLDKGENKKASDLVKSSIRELTKANKRLSDSEIAKEIQSLKMQQKQIEQLGSRNVRDSYEGKVLKKAVQQRMYQKASK